MKSLDSWQFNKLSGPRGGVDGRQRHRRRPPPHPILDPVRRDDQYVRLKFHTLARHAGSDAGDVRCRSYDPLPLHHHHSSNRKSSYLFYLTSGADRHRFSRLAVIWSSRSTTTRKGASTSDLLISQTSSKRCTSGNTTSFALWRLFRRGSSSYLETRRITMR